MNPVTNRGDVSAATVLDVVWRCGVTTLCAPPTVWRMLIQEDLKKYRVKIRELIGAGEPLQSESPKRSTPRHSFDFGNLFIVLLIAVPIVGTILRSIFGNVGGSVIGAGVVGAGARSLRMRSTLQKKMAMASAAGTATMTATSWLLKLKEGGVRGLDVFEGDAPRRVHARAVWVLVLRAGRVVVVI